MPHKVCFLHLIKFYSSHLKMLMWRWKWVPYDYAIAADGRVGSENVLRYLLCDKLYQKSIT